MIRRLFFIWVMGQSHSIIYNDLIEMLLVILLSPRCKYCSYVHSHPVNVTTCNEETLLKGSKKWDNKHHMITHAHKMYTTETEAWGTNPLTPPTRTHLNNQTRANCQRHLHTDIKTSKNVQLSKYTCKRQEKTDFEPLSLRNVSTCPIWPFLT